jgi:hypothetical protein
MQNKNLFEALQQICNFTALESDMFEIIAAVEKDKVADYEPYFGWCNVKGCENEGCSGGSAWRESGYWTVCYKHADDYRNGKPQPTMKKAAIDREASRDENGCITVDLKVPKKEIQ